MVRPQPSLRPASGLDGCEVQDAQREQQCNGSWCSVVRTGAILLSHRCKAALHERHPVPYIFFTVQGGSQDVQKKVQCSTATTSLLPSLASLSSYLLPLCTFAILKRLCRPFSIAEACDLRAAPWLRHRRRTLTNTVAKWWRSLCRRRCAPSSARCTAEPHPARCMSQASSQNLFPQPAASCLEQPGP